MRHSACSSEITVTSVEHPPCVSAVSHRGILSTNQRLSRPLSSPDEYLKSPHCILPFLNGKIRSFWCLYFSLVLSGEATRLAPRPSGKFKVLGWTQRSLSARARRYEGTGVSRLGCDLRFKVRPTAQNLRSLLMQPKYNPHQAKRGHNLGTLDVSHSPAPSHPPRSSGRKVAKYSVCESSSVLSRACGGESYKGSHVVYRTKRLDWGRVAGRDAMDAKLTE